MAISSGSESERREILDAIDAALAHHREDSSDIEVRIGLGGESGMRWYAVLVFGNKPCCEIEAAVQTVEARWRSDKGKTTVLK